MILTQIVSENLQELEAKKRNIPLAEMRDMALEQPPPLDFASALKGNGIRLIAEIKKASPSRGVIRSDFRPAEIAQIYSDNGAAAISVLTEPRYFQGSLDYLKDIRTALVNKALPLLRKDFIFDPYQIYESRANGADSLLLIAAILEPEKLQELLGISNELNMSPLVEVHNEAEIKVALNSDARIIGINNRDLNTFAVDTGTTERLRPLIPPERIVVSESGIGDRNDIEKLQQLNVHAVLIGESLMKAADIAAKMKEFV
jgi:indole-3-glycerol phosphate synthase